MKKITLLIVIVISCFCSQSYGQCAPDNTPPTLVCNTAELLTNPGFENGTANNTPGAGNNWNVFGNVFSLDFNNPTPQAGQFFIKTFAGNSGVFQDAAISPGDELLATGYVLNASFDPMGVGCTGRVKIEFLNAVNGIISVVETVVDHTIPSNVWQKLTVSATAPANAFGARFVFQEQCPGGGAVMFDSGSLINITAGSAGNIALNNDPGSCGAIVDFGPALATDNCPGAVAVTQTAGMPSGSLFPIGTTTNTFAATDASGNMVSCSFDITVTDTEAPFILCGTPSNLLTNPSFEIGTGNNVQGAGPGWSPFGVAPFALDATIGGQGPGQDGQYYLKMFGGNSGIFQDIAIGGGDVVTASAYLLNAPIDPIPAGGKGFVKIEFLDAGNSQISFIENFVDNTLPSNVWTLVTVNATAPANAVTARFVLAASTPPGPGAVFFDDASLGNASVPSGTNPTYANDPGQCGAIVNYPVPTGTDNCPNPVTVLTSGIGSGNFFPIGTHTETYTVTDASGLMATCDLTITVEDTEAPTVACGQAELLTNTSFETGTGFNQPGAGPGWANFGVPPFGIDATIIGPGKDGQFFMKMFGPNSGIFQDAAISGGDQITGSAYLMNAAFDPIKPGCKGFVKLEFLDAANNQISFSESFIDDTSPINVWQLVSINATAPANATTVRLVLSVDCPVGAVMFDQASLINQSAVAMSIFALDNDPGECGAMLNFGAAFASDNCPGAIALVQTSGLASGSLFPIGTTTNTFEATDAIGNTSTCSFDVTVTDTEAPIIICGTPSNLLTNSSFEMGTGFNQPGAGPGWTNFGVVPFGIDANIIGPSQDGQFYLKMFGGNSGIFQDAAISGGDLITGSAYLMNASFDPIHSGCKGFVKLEFLDATNTQISVVENFIDATAPQNVWQLVTVTAAAPANATTARFVLVADCPAGGAVMFDDADLGNASVPSGTNPIYPNDPGQCGATVNYPVPAGTDNCPGAVTTLVSGLGSGSFFPIGTYIETYVVTDNAGLTATCDLTITVEDSEGPIVSCGQAELLTNTSFETGTGFNQPGAGPGWINFGVPPFGIDATIIGPGKDGQFFMKMFGPNSGIFQDAAINGGDQITGSAYLMNAAFDPIKPGCKGFVKLEFLDAGNNQILFVEDFIDDTSPIDVWQLVTINATAPANATTVRLVLSVDCPTGAVMFDQASLINQSAGAVIVFTLNNDPGECGAMLNFGDAFASDNCPGVVTVMQTTGLPSGSLFPIGTTTNTFEATDANGNTSTCSFDVTVTDIEAPIIICGSPSNLLTNSSFETGTGFNQPGAGPGWTNFGVVPFGIDATIIGPAQDGQFYLKMFGGNSGIFQDVAVSGGDLITGSAYLMNASFDPIHSGCKGFVKLEFFDAGNNFISFVENFIDATAPQNVWQLKTVTTAAPANATTARFVLVADCPAGGAVMFDDANVGNASVPSGTNPTYPNDPGQCGATITYPVPVGTDNCAVTTTLTSGIGSGGFFPVGTHIETYVVTDNSGLTATCDLTITVEDTEAPIAVCNSFAIPLDPTTGTATLLGTDIGYGSSDPCGISTYTVSKSLFSCADVALNPHQVMLTVTDPSGNTATCMATVTVDVNPDPGTDGALTICETGAPASLFGQLGGNPDPGGVWAGPSFTTGGSLGIYDPTSMDPGIYSYSVFSTTSGCSCLKAMVIVMETAAPDPGISASIDVCGNAAPTSLFDQLGGTPETGGVWTGPSSLGNGDRGMFDPATASPGTYTYTLNSPGCSPEMSTVMVTILMEPMIPSIADIVACDGDPTDIAPTPVPGMSFNFYDADPTAGSATLLAGPAASYDPGTQAGNTSSVWVTTTNGTCESDPIQVMVTVNALPNGMAGSNSPLYVGMTMNLFSSGGTSYAWSGPNGFTSNVQNPSKANVVLADCGVFTVVVTDQNGCSKTITIAVLAIPNQLRSQVSPNMILEGPYDPVAGLMRDDLRSQQLIPTTEPYTALGFTHTGVGETLAPITLTVTGNNAIVDWVLVELRDATTPQTLISTRAALLQRDGDVVDTDGVSPVAFPNISIPTGNYLVSVRHRNHLGAMLLSPLSISPVTSAIADFSNLSTVTWGTGATLPMNGSALLLGGNVLQDGMLKYSGPFNDRAPILQAVGGLNPTHVITGYHQEDVNLDGTVKYSGPANDRAIILKNVGGSDPTAIKTEQLP